VTDAPLVPRQPDAAPAVYDVATLAVLAAMEKAADEHLDSLIPKNTKRGYANDWALWEEFHDWLAERTGHRTPSTAVTKGMLVGFVVWLDTVKLAAPTSIDRRITGVTVTARGLGVEVPKAATVAARKALKPLKADEDRIARGRGQAKAATPEQLRQMAAAVPDSLTGLRDRALWLMAFFIAGRSAEVAALRADGITLHSEGLKVRVPGVKGKPAREVVVMYGKNPDTCPVRAWSVWKAASNITAGSAFVAIDKWGNLGSQHLTAEAVREIIARSAERAGVVVRLTGHSMRAGFITTSRRAGKREEKIREQSGHADGSPVFWRYIRDADKWTDAATDDIL
jgi:integrase